MLYGRKSISLIIHSEAPSHWHGTREKKSFTQKPKGSGDDEETEKCSSWNSTFRYHSFDILYMTRLRGQKRNVCARKVMETRTKWGQLDVLISEVKKTAVQLTDSKFMSLFHLSLYWNEELFSSNAHKSWLFATLRKNGFWGSSSELIIFHSKLKITNRQKSLWQRSQRKKELLSLNSISIKDQLWLSHLNAFVNLLLFCSLWTKNGVFVELEKNRTSNKFSNFILCYRLSTAHCVLKHP